MNNTLLQNLQSLYIDARTGKYVAKKEEEKGLCGFQYKQTIESATWNINHGRNFSFFLFSVFIEQGNELVEVLPNSLKVLSSNNLIINFSSPVKGLVNILYYVSDKNLCESIDIDPLSFIFGGINSMDINSVEING